MFDRRYHTYRLKITVRSEITSKGAGEREDGRKRFEERFHTLRHVYFRLKQYDWRGDIIYNKIIGDNMLCSLLFRENGVNSDFFLLFFFLFRHTITRLLVCVMACVRVCVVLYCLLRFCLFPVTYKIWRVKHGLWIKKKKKLIKKHLFTRSENNYLFQ